MKYTTTASSTREAVIPYGVAAFLLQKIMAKTRTSFIKGHKHSPETIAKLKMHGDKLIGNKRALGFRHTEETKKKMSLDRRGKKRPHGKPAWNKGMKMGPSPMKGKKMSLSDEAREKMRLSKLGKKQSPETIEKRAKACTGKKRSAEFIRSRSGENCHFWKGGITNISYSVDWTKTLKRSIRERDKYTCCICGEPQEERAHDVHHIDYDKTNCNPENLITLCHKCHVKTNGKRDLWKKFFEQLTQ